MTSLNIFRGEACFRKKLAASGVPPPPPPTNLFPSWSVDISFKDDVTVILLIGDSLIVFNYEYWLNNSISVLCNSGCMLLTVCFHVYILHCVGGRERDWRVWVHRPPHGRRERPHGDRQHPPGNSRSIGRDRKKGGERKRERWGGGVSKVKRPRRRWEWSEWSERWCTNYEDYAMVR